MELEVKKDQLSQKQSGDWKITFTASSEDIPAELLGAAMGTRYRCVLIDADREQEEAVYEEVKNYVAMAAIMCGKEAFQKYALIQLGVTDTNLDSERMKSFAITYLRDLCGIKSRAELKDNKEAIDKLKRLNRDFDAWLRY